MQNKSDLFEPELNALAAQARALSHPARITILELLAEHDTCICGEITEQLPLAQATTSQHLKVLREARLVKAREVGPSVCYCLNKEVLLEVRAQFEHLFAKLLDLSADPDCC